MILYLIVKKGKKESSLLLKTAHIEKQGGGWYFFLLCTVFSYIVANILFIIMDGPSQIGWFNPS